ncbi:hypothetical protein [Rathayibacter sp. VKM Ac-2630]|uniref:hypothetical protein n=1 Tax=Rathayibacter sp. VKM Ac-2630 TaxID=1938617 RepID=UPI0009D27BEF|nr:hypothetical protein [Rathayibacter sp. VKM Ac-2630]OOB90320.1 hypothetical protein B0T42_12535 [Rathayibacter sp. VKM Ac-2630]
MTWHMPAIVALVLVALALTVAKVAVGSFVFDGVSVLIVVLIVLAGVAGLLSLVKPEAASC